MWYVAQVQAGRESATRDLCLRLVSPDVLEECFMPEYETMWRVRGEWKLARRLLFPGYLFFVTGDAEELNKELLRVPLPIRLLGNEENSFFPLTKKEQDWFLSFMDGNHTVRMSEGYISGDKITVTRGPLMGFEGDIRKIDRHKRRALPRRHPLRPHRAGKRRPGSSKEDRVSHPNRTVMGKSVEPVGGIFAGPRSKGRAHHFLGSSSEWQAVNLKRAIAITVFVLSALAFFFLVFNGLFVIYAETCHPELTWEQVAEVEVDGKPASPSEGEEAPQSMRPQIELALSLFSAVVMLISARLVWRYYRKGYEVKEEPVVFPQKGSEIRWRKIFGSQTDLKENVQAYADEFLVNAFVEPRMVFSRISESVSPGRRMLDSVVSYEVLPPTERGLSFFDADDLMLKKDKENRKFRSCSLVVPVSFQKRGKLVMKQEVRNASGTILPVLKQSEFVARILELIHSFLASVCVDAKNRPIGNLPQWDDLLSDLEAAFRSWFIADDGRNELQKSGDSNSRRQIAQLPSRSISAGNLVFSS